MARWLWRVCPSVVRRWVGVRCRLSCVTAPGLHRDEKAFNSWLGHALGRRNRRAEILTETTGQLRAAQKQPDMTVRREGREPVLVENKYSSATPNLLVGQCQERLSQWWADGRPVTVVVGVRTPARLASVPDAALANAIEQSGDFEWASWTVRRGRLPHEGWLSGSVDDLAAFVDRASEDAVSLSGLVDTVRNTLFAAALQIENHPNSDIISEGFGHVLHQAGGEQTNRMAMAVMFNAVLFQSHIAGHHPEILSPTQMIHRGQVNQQQVLAQWKCILGIDYWPIYDVSERLLDECISDEALAKSLLEVLYRAVARIAGKPGAGGLIGRLFGELIEDRKFLATFYTRPASALFLAELAVDRLAVDWSSPEAIANLRIGDMACGTGALLTAVYRRIAERHRVAGGDEGDIHRSLVEDVLIGCDIMPAAVHLTAARLSGERPDIDYTGTKTWVLPYGEIPTEAGPTITLGSLDLLRSNQTGALWGNGTYAVTAHGEMASTIAEVPDRSLDLVIMNPPFTRPTNHEAVSALSIPVPSFAGFANDKEAQKAMSKKLKQIKRRLAEPIAGHGNAGLGSNFVDLAHAKLKPGGVLALILPAKVIEGPGWQNTRVLLAHSYENIAVVTISSGQNVKSESRAFSADTGIAEAIVVATRRADEDVPPGEVTDVDAVDAGYAILRSRPSTSAAAVETARSVVATTTSSGLRQLSVGDQSVGWAITAKLDPSGGGHPSGVANRSVAQAALALGGGQLALPPHQPVALAITALRHLGSRGPVHRDINGETNKGDHRGPFDVERLRTRDAYQLANWPILWSHDNKRETTMVVLPCSQGTVRPDMDDKAYQIWDGYVNRDNEPIAGAGRLHISNDFRLNSQSLGACLTPGHAIGGRAWPSFAPTPTNSDDEPLWEKALALWLNTTPGLIARWWVSSRQTPGRANLTVSTIGNIPVLDLREVPPTKIRDLADLFDRFCSETFLPANEAFHDSTRQKVDRAVLHEVLELPETILRPLATLRLQWCAEPSVRGGKKTGLLEA